ncbi:MAG: DUF692 domain-containing protein [Rhodocyclaceae bacterium]|nr:DUF692 domain-containing protein [Rhodocyclaceae bacterium]
MAPATASSLPNRAGIGLRSPHLSEVRRNRPPVPWFEVHSENYFVSGGPSLQALLDVRSDYPISLHGVGMSIGSSDPLNQEHLRKLEFLVDTIEPAAVSEHLCWSAIDGRWLNDLLPLSYTNEALNQVCSHVSQVQDTLRRPILVENVSSYLRFHSDEMYEWEFLAQVARRTGCQILLDINNIYVSARNHRFNENDFLAGIPVGTIGEIHLAGYEVVEEDGDELLIDTHSRPVYPEVWTLYQKALERFGAVPTLIEWDQDIPSLATLMEEAAKAQVYLDVVAIPELQRVAMRG